MATLRLTKALVDALKPRKCAYGARDVRQWFASLHQTPVPADRSATILSVIMRQAEVYG